MMHVFRFSLHFFMHTVLFWVFFSALMVFFLLCSIPFHLIVFCVYVWSCMRGCLGGCAACICVYVYIVCMCVYMYYVVYMYVCMCICICVGIYTISFFF